MKKLLIAATIAVAVAALQEPIVNSFKSTFSATENVAPENGIYKWPVKRVVDGDTLEVEESFLPKELKLFVRIKNIDTPEKAPRAKCDKENKLAQKASEFTQKAIDEAIKNNQEITFSELKWDKYGGRVLAEVKINNKSLAQDLMKNGLGRQYHGEKKQSWCD
jgi:micrococcal nuclease